tara:strand:+ start:1277 stop:2287 length:1011 start_codon:yes stop_codon:yes gene_type:complete
MKIDLRSDTLTVPSSEMLKEMMSAKVGDDVWEEDPTVKTLENIISNMFKVEAALFCPSGTMANQIAIRSHTQIGDQLICDVSSHIYNYEGGGIASNSGVSVKLLNGNRGRISVEQIKSSINPDDPHFPKTKLVCLENTCNKGGGSCYEIEAISKISNFCRSNNLNIHLDGARLFNAIVAKNQNPIDYGKAFDSISICLSKGLGAPVGSLLLGTGQFIHNAKRVRKSLGGGMRQIGYLAAAGIFALENNINRLSQDHDRAKIIYRTLKNSKYIEEVMPCETNIIIFKIFKNKIDSILQKFDQNEILYSKFGEDMIRFVTHLNFDDKQLDKLLKVLKS